MFEAQISDSSIYSNLNLSYTANKNTTFSEQAQAQIMTANFIRKY